MSQLTKNDFVDMFFEGVKDLKNGATGSPSLLTSHMALGGMIVSDKAIPEGVRKTALSQMQFLEQNYAESTMTIKFDDEKMKKYEEIAEMEVATDDEYND